MPTALIVEDDSNFRHRLKRFLSSQFPTVFFTEAGNGKEAFSEIDSSLPAFVFMDIKLSGENGLELTKRIKDKHPEIIVVILSNYDFLEYRDAAFKNGADYFLVKGTVSLVEIGALVKSLLSRMSKNTMAQS